MELISSFLTDTGRKRKANEDSGLAADWLGLYVVCDGMGGHSCGDVASQTAIEVIKGSIENAKKKGTLETKPCEVFVDAIKLGNRAVWELSQGMPKCASMGTTMAGVLIHGNTFFTAHVGDSRVYRIRGGKIEPLTRDHSLVEEQIALGTLKREDARNSPVKNVITRAMGLNAEVKVETAQFEALAGDFILICSDGLNGMITDETIEEVINKNTTDTLNATTAELIELANLNGGTDNITVVLLKF
ncbi:MAG: Stp1/IreP family PP2C-type Ser/Thr phosphatase [Deltaproteobacteria bacterium]|nr:Stp1/IreP family PP2C-type Ser/Thr phosphatase [Deltaproteobacteria bacterium]